MAFKKSPGQTKTCLVRLDQNTAEVRDALLYDFDIDDDDLKEAQQAVSRASDAMGGGPPRRKEKDQAVGRARAGQSRGDPRRGRQSGREHGFGDH